jgi:ABC-type transporter Mla subunit MlaD
MAKTRTTSKAVKRRRDPTFEDVQAAKRKLRALEQADRDIARLADRVTRAYKASRARLLVLAEHIAAEQGLELRAKFPIARTREELDLSQREVGQAFAAGGDASGAPDRA